VQLRVQLAALAKLICKSGKSEVNSCSNFLS